jgi:hypothetical protein
MNPQAQSAQWTTRNEDFRADRERNNAASFSKSGEDPAERNDPAGRGAHSRDVRDSSRATNPRMRAGKRAASASGSVD